MNKPPFNLKKLCNALEAARHELTIFHGLIAFDGMAPNETFSIDTNSVIRQIDKALNGASCSDNHHS